MTYQPQKIEKKWQSYWKEKKTFRAENLSSRPKFYVLDMFPYPSGAGLHVGHPLGYIASDIVSRAKRHQGFNVLHPMGWDAFGLPAEQYAIETGQHPAVTTEKNIATYRSQLERIGLSFDWEREVSTADPNYYKWTQWCFVELFRHYFNGEQNKARPIEELEKYFSEYGSKNHSAVGGKIAVFSAQQWQAFSRAQREEVLGQFRLAYQADLPVNWCPALGTVLANDEVKDGLSVRGAHPVEQRVMRQWSLRISVYGERLLTGLEKIQWSEAIKEMQRHWIGKSEGAELDFSLQNRREKIRVFTTRPDTIFGVSSLILAPEHPLVAEICTEEQRAKVHAYIQETKKRSERERQADVKRVSGCFTGAYALHPFNAKPLPIWIADYVLASYGTGAIMSVPAHDSRDYAFAKHFQLPILEVVEGGDVQNEAYEAKAGKIIQSDFLNGLSVQEALSEAGKEIEKRGLGVRRTNYRLRDASFSRQRYWGEPIPMAYANGHPEPLPLSELPLKLPEVDKFLPTSSGDPPLARAKNWNSRSGLPLETTTMPGFAGSSAYYFRYMDPKNDRALVDRKTADYWGAVDLYIGGSEHATGHLIYSRFWCKFLFDLGHVPVDEPFQKLVNQGLIQGQSFFVYRRKDNPKLFVSEGLKDRFETQALHVHVELVEDGLLNLDGFKSWKPEFKDAQFLLEEREHQGKKFEVYRCGTAVEKMSKSFFNVVNPDSICSEYGADTLRLFEMFLGPLEQSKPWNMSGIEGVHRFIQKVWRWVHGGTEGTEIKLRNEQPSAEEWRALHITIDKVTRDVDQLSFNTSVAQFMIFINEVGAKAPANKAFLESFLILLSPFAPHLCEELWQGLGHSESITNAAWPKADPTALAAQSLKLVIQVNGKLRGEFEAPLSATQEEIFALALANPEVKKLIEGKEIKKKIYVPKKLVNLVIPT
jgi:leucyl-tRNA synthetase